MKNTWYLELTEHQTRTIINLLYPFAHKAGYTDNKEALEEQKDVNDIYDKIQLHLEYFPMDG